MDGSQGGVLRRYRSRLFRTLDDLDGSRWDASGSPPSFYSSFPWLQTIDETLALDGVTDSAFVTVEREGSPPSAAMAVYRVSKDFFESQYPPRLVAEAELEEELAPFLDPHERDRLATLRASLAGSLGDGVDSAVCFIPYAFTAGVRIREADSLLASALLEKLDEIGRAWRVRSKAFLFVPDDAPRPLVAALEDRGFAAGLFDARSRIEIRWSSFDDYLQALRSNHRAAIRKELRALAANDLRSEVVEGPMLPAISDDLAQLSARLMERYGFAFDLERERLSYATIYRHLESATTAFVVRHDENIVAFCLFHRLGDRLAGGMSGQDYAYDYVHFVSTYYEPLRYAIDHGIKSIDYGVGSYQSKTMRGCTLQQLFGYFSFDDARPDDVRELLELQTTARQRLLAQYESTPWRVDG